MQVSSEGNPGKGSGNPVNSSRMMCLSVWSPRVCLCSGIPLHNIHYHQAISSCHPFSALVYQNAFIPVNWTSARKSRLIHVLIFFVSHLNYLNQEIKLLACSYLACFFLYSQAFSFFILITVKLPDWLKLQIPQLRKIPKLAIFMQKLSHRIKWFDLDLL